ncbi:MAG: c-type cytochrome [bacterium]|nr:c-type cytochrome [bacterium]
MNLPGKTFLICTVLSLSLLADLRSPLRAGSPEISVQIERLENTWLYEVADGDYQILVEGEPLKRITGAELPALRDLEIKLQKQKQKDPRAAQQLNALLIAMGRIADEPTLIYLHELFESYPERRNDVAEAISWYSQENQRRDADWRILVRSLNIVEGKQARAVMQALTRFHRRSNKAQWIRQVILVGLQQNPEGQAIAVKLLEHWTGQHPAQSGDAASSPLVAWQKWFAQKYPDELPAELPVESEDSRWKYAGLLKELKNESTKPANLKLGAEAFVKATCVKCHLFGKTGEKIGPDLTHVSRRFQQKEILQATIFPSHFVSEEYPTFTIITSAGKSHTGMMGAAGPDEIMLLTSEGKRQLIKKKDVDEIIPVKKSSMPDGLLNLLTKAEAVQLIRYLSRLPEGASEAYRHTTR